MRNIQCVSNDIIDVIKADALTEFEQLSKVYRPSFGTRKICDYLKNRVAELAPGVEVFEDAYRSNLIDDNNNPKLSSGNIWFDIPANDESMKNNEPIILQAHMDMVCAFANEEARKNLEQNGVDLQYHDNGTLTARDHLTSLGADNGIGVAIMLAIIKNQTYKHGPIRFIFTTDEECGMCGASYLGLTRQGEKGFPVQGFKYLINNDNAFDGEILLSTAGRVISSYFIPTEPDTPALDPNIPVYQLEITGLLGGHSGDWIAKHIGATIVASDLLNAFNADDDLVLIEFTNPGCDSQNAIPTHAHALFATSKVSLEKMMQLCNEKVEEIKYRYSLETDVKISIAQVELPANIEIRPYPHNITNNILKLTREAKTGVIAWKDKSIEWIETSGNLGPIYLTIKKTEKDGKTIWSNPSFELQHGFRSCNNEAINELAADNKKLAKDALGHDDLDYYKLRSVYYGFPGNKDARLVEIAKNSFQEHGVKCSTRHLHGGLEVSWFNYMNPDLNMLSIGAEIHKMHDCGETLYTGTLDAVIGVTLDVISQMKYINEK